MFSSKTETRYQEVDFGDPIKQTFTNKISDLVIIGGSASPLEGEFAYDQDEINKIYNNIHSIFLYTMYIISFYI